MRDAKLWIASRSLSAGAHSRNPLARNDGSKTRHTPAVIARLDRAIQYSEAPVMEQKSRGVLDTPPESVIGLAQCQARWPVMTVLRSGASAALFGAAHQLDTRLCGVHQAAIGGEIVERHPARGESRLELFADCISAQAGKAIDRGDRADFVLHDKAGKPVIDDLRDRATDVGNDRGAARHRFDHDEAERLRPVDRDQPSDRAAQKLRFFGIPDLADRFDNRIAVDHRANYFMVIFLIGPIDLRRDLERNAAP